MTPRTRTPSRAGTTQTPQGFGRVRVGVHGRVIVAVAEGPFDAELMSGTRRALAQAGKRLPADRRFVDLLEIRVSLQIDDEALERLRAAIDGFAARGIVAISTVFLVSMDLPGVERLPAVMDIWRASRPVRWAADAATAWALVNADLANAGLPTQTPPNLQPVEPALKPLTPLR